MGGDKIRTQARRLSTPSYAEGEWADTSFKTQWRWSLDDDYGRFHPFETVHKKSPELNDVLPFNKFLKPTLLLSYNDSNGHSQILPNKNE